MKYQKTHKQSSPNYQILYAQHLVYEIKNPMSHWSSTVKSVNSEHGRKPVTERLRSPAIQQAYKISMVDKISRLQAKSEHLLLDKISIRKYEFQW